MTVEVAGIWEEGWNTPIKEADLWEMAARSIEEDVINMSPVSGIERKRITEHASMEKCIEAKAHLTRVYVDENGAVELADFEHPEDALYVFGKCGQSPFMQDTEGHLSVRIDCTKMGMLWPHQAMAIVLHDRWRK
jgi:hypothetical protein